MTLSPGQKVEPKRSMRMSPGGLSACCSSILSERAPRPPRFIGHRTWMSRIGSKPKRLGMRSRTTVSTFRTPSSGSAASTKVKITGFGTAEIGHQSLVDAMGADDDPALGGLTEDLGQAHDRHS